jgi:hypothetical protein
MQITQTRIHFEVLCDIGASCASLSARNTETEYDPSKNLCNLRIFILLRFQIFRGTQLTISEEKR